MKYIVSASCDDCKRLTTGDCGKHNPVIYGSGMVEKRVCEHCFCQDTIIFTETGQPIRHKICCNCGFKKAREGWRD